MKTFCASCSKETKNPKFCSRSCAAKHTNTAKPKKTRLLVVGTAICARCLQSKEDKSFLLKIDPAGLARYSSICADCRKARGKKYTSKRSKKPLTKEKRREYRLRYLYGLSLTDYDDLLQAQNGLCALGCGKEARVVDHCHETGKVRGLLCTGCNTTIGKMGDTIEKVQRIIMYLEKSALL